MLQADGAQTVVGDRFRLERLLGRGGAGEVHAAFDLVQQRPVALKSLHAEETAAIEGMREEFRVLRALSHPGIVRVYDFGHLPNGAPFYTMELLDGQPLDRTNECVDPERLLPALAVALDYIHQQGLVHSDLKPGNVFVVGDSFKLTDFGLVQRRHGRAREAPFGTLAYMPAERLRHENANADPREDLYALGAIVFEQLAGRPPYAGPTAEATIAAILDGDLDRQLEAVPEKWRRILGRCLHPDATGRYASAWELLQVWSAQGGAPLPPPPIWDAPFVGRRRELSRLRQALGNAARGRGSFAYISGPPGMGKSALLEAACGQIAAHGLPCWQFVAPPAAAPHSLVESLATLYGNWRSALPDGAALAAARLANWSQALQNVADASDPDAIRNLNAHALADMGWVASHVPHAILVDDAHRLDSGSRALLALLAVGVEEMPILLLVAGRFDSEVDSDNAAGSFEELARLTREASTGSVLKLGELSAEDVALLVHRRFAAGYEFDSLAERIYELTHGHPFFVTETLNHLVLTEQVRRDREHWTILPQAERKLMPHLAETLLTEHVDRSPPEDRVVFETLSLIPGGAGPDLLQQVLDGDSAALVASLDNGVKAGLLQLAAERHYVFRHELMREACAARCAPARARQAHLQLAAALAGRPTEAYHRLRAGDRSPAARDCFLAAAADYERRSAYWEAARYYEAALGMAPDASDANTVALQVARLQTLVGRNEEAVTLLRQHLPAIEAPLTRARYLRQLGLAYGKQGRNDEAVLHLRSAASACGQHAEAQEQCTVTVDLASVLIEKGDYAAAVEATRRLLTAVPSAPPQGRAALMLAQARAELQRGAYEAAESTCRAALELLKPLGRTREVARTYTQLGTNYHFRGEYAQAERFHQAALKAYRELGDLYAAMNAQNNIGLAQMRAGRVDEAIVSFEESLDLKRQLGDLRGQGSGYNNLGNLWERRGEYLRALRSYRHGIRIFRRLQRPRELATLYNNMGEVYLRVGRFLSARRYLQRAASQAQGLGDAYIGLVVALNHATTCLRLLEQEAAAGILKELQHRVDTAKLPGLAAQVCAWLAVARARAGDASDAARMEREALRLLPADEKDARLEVLLALAECAESLCHHGELGQHASEARALAERLDRPHEQAKSLRLLATAHLAQGDWDRSEQELRQAVERCQPAGFRYELAKCYKLLGFLRWDIGLRARATEDFEHAFGLLEELGLRTELGLTYLEVARLARGGASG